MQMPTQMSIHLWIHDILVCYGNICVPVYIGCLNFFGCRSSKLWYLVYCVCRFLQGIWCCTQIKDGANTSSIWFPKRSCYCYNDGLQRHKGHGLLTWCWHWFLCQWSLIRRCIGTISIHNLPWLHTMNVSRSNERKWLLTKKRQEANYWKLL